ncbi:MBL fold metallo-hydrolase [Sphingomonas xanthus]|uniref:MBL fold metallo-hydrolase n=1 Tax=Sphingomonas xanthus TaxID=2594473 RepID=A0A516IP35_9SPHN|nr:MBL fold metallo-hydrolase [Sphingomonas xanthus]QDP18606.1 MBL fold metallo-hydrolase [Sphingomonas xanthus]
MKIRVLGCGTSTGVPRIGNDWGRCDPADPRNRRTRSSILLDTGSEHVLVDCGPDLRQQLLDADVATIDRVIVTHDHADHCHGIDELRVVSQTLGRQVPLHARAETLRRLRNRFAYAFNGNPLYPSVLDAVEIDQALPVEDALIMFVDQPHGGITSLGMRVDQHGKSFGYAIDFHALTPDMASIYDGLDIWLCDCLRRTPHPTHAHLDAVLGWARDLGVGQLLLTHLDNSMDYATLAAELPDWAAPAFDGQELNL